MSASTFDMKTRSARYLDLSGFAADGVASVGVIDRDGILHSAKVIDNVYHSDLDRPEVRALIALDDSGGEIFRRNLK
jgi:hypothetical protein